MPQMEEYFDEVVAMVQGMMQGNEQFTCSLSAEQSDFIRFNLASIRQAGHVSQAFLNLQLFVGRRHASATLGLTRDVAADRRRLSGVLEELRSAIKELDEDPFLEFNTDIHSSRSVTDAGANHIDAMVDTILASARGVDLVGFLANGPQQRGFANSIGQRNWHEVRSFNFEWSLYYKTDKAVKSAYADFVWDDAAYARRMARARGELEVIARPAKRLSPGAYRAYLAPSALSDVVNMLSWGGFSEKARRTRQSPLQRLVEGESLNPMVSMSENTAEGLAPIFQAEGYLRPAKVDLIVGGRDCSSLISPRTAREYGLAQNGADADAEQPQSLDVAAGTIGQNDILKELGTGLFLNNLWYLNFSDRMNCKLTGMTRFAALWVENGEVVAPLDVMRFDDSVYRMLGSNLLGLTKEREFIPDSATYEERLVLTQRLPGALIDDFRLTL